jgi:hypothetical protein
LPPPADLASGLRTRNGEFESSWGLHFIIGPSAETAVAF